MPAMIQAKLQEITAVLVVVVVLLQVAPTSPEALEQQVRVMRVVLGEVLNHQTKMAPGVVVALAQLEQTEHEVDHRNLAVLVVLVSHLLLQAQV